MSTPLIITLMVAALIIAGLSFYLGRLLLLIDQGKKDRAQTRADEIARRNKTLRNQNSIKSQSNAGC